MFVCAQAHSAHVMSERSREAREGKANEKKMKRYRDLMVKNKKKD